MTSLEFHPLANLLPLLTGKEQADLQSSIEKNGQREPIVLFEGKILDGRNRYLACRSANVEPLLREFGSESTDGDDPFEFVLSVNLTDRRHLNDRQRSVVAAKAATIARGGDRKSGFKSSIELSIDDAAKRFDVSPASVKRAREVITKGIPELTDLVATDQVPVSNAALVAGRAKGDRCRGAEGCEGQGERDSRCS